MALTFVAISDATVVASGDITLSEPAGVQEGDLLVACIAFRASVAFTLPAGWALVASQQLAGNTNTTTSTSVASGLMAYILRGAVEVPTTFTRTGGDVALGRIASYRGVDRLNPYDTGSANTPASNASLTPTTAISTAVNDELLVMACCLADNLSPTLQRSVTDPLQQHWHERADSSTTIGADVALAIADATKLLAGNTGELRFTDGLTRNAIIVGAFRPAARRIRVQRLAVAQRLAADSNATFTTASFTPPNDCLLVVAAAIERQGGAHTGVAVSDSTGLVWTNRVAATADDGTWFYQLSLWTAAVAAGTSMTASLSETTDNDAVHVHVLAVTGHDRSNPIGASASLNDTADETCAMTLSAVPAAGSIVLAARCLGVVSGSSSATPGIGWWEVTDENIVDWHKLAVQARYDNPSTAVAWTDVDDANLSDEGLCAVALEIRHAPSLAQAPSPMQSFLMR
jgi:hypothetical protein